MSAAFLITTLIVVATPGIGVLYTLAAGLTEGRRASVVAAFACTLGIVPHMAAAILGVAALLNTSALAFQTLKFAGVAYLLFMAWQTLAQSGSLHVESAQPTVQRSSGRIIVSGVLANLLDPKLFAAAVRKHVVSRPRVLTWMRRTFAGAFVALGAKLAATAR